MSENKKVYGLILPKKTAAQENKQKTSTFNVFGNESDEEEKVQGPVGPYGQVAKPNSKMKRQTQMDIEKAIQEDPSVYEYDNIYDDMQAAKPRAGYGEKKKQTIDRKPKYIAGLLKASEEKKKEDERRKERQVQKEREAEGEQFADKESFVTSAYKKKMLEMQEEEEMERKKAELEALRDVTKQKDMSGFYRYLYHQTTGPEVEPEVKTEVKQEGDSEETEPISHERSRQPKIEVKQEPNSPPVRSKSSGSESDSDKTEKSTLNKQSKDLSSKNLRKRVSSSSSESSPQHKSKSPESLSRSKSRTIAPKSRSPKSRKSRSRSPMRKRSRSRSPMRKRSSSRSPMRKISRSRSPIRKRSRSRSPMKKRSRSRSPVRKRSRSRSPRDKKSQYPKTIENADRSRSPKQRMHNRKREIEQRRRIRSTEKEILSDQSEENDPILTENTRNPALKSGKENLSDKKIVKEKTAEEVPPSQKVYPHHNSAKDIQEARKRYLQRKLAREKTYIG